MEDKYDLNIEKREAIVAKLHVGMSILDIVKAVGVSTATIYNVKRYLRERGSVARKPGSRKQPSVVTNRLLAVVKSRIRRNPVRRGMAREIGVSEFSIRKDHRSQVPCQDIQVSSHRPPEGCQTRKM